jgi:hypothetical protein
MPPIPASKLTELLLSRRKLFEKIVQHVATRKIQNHVQATGARMAATPEQFGMQVGKQMGKQAFLGPGLLGAGIGAATSPAGHRMEGASRGAVKATGTSLGAVAGVPAGVLTALMLLKGKKLPRIPGRGPIPYPMGRRSAENLARLYAAVGVGAPAGAAVGGGAGYAGTSALLGKPSWEKKEAGVASSALNSVRKGLGAAAKTLASDDVFYPAVAGTVGAGGALAASEAYRALKTPAAKPPAAVNKTLPRKPIVGGLDRDGLSPLQQMTAPLMRILTGTPDVPRYGAVNKQASVLSVLGGLTGGGLGGLAGGAGGGILGALGGGALGGGPGAGLGLLAGGAAGLGAGAHMGGNIGANIGASFSKKKEKPESEEKEEKSEEKSEDSGDEEVKKSAAAVLAQLQNNAK